MVAAAWLEAMVRRRRRRAEAGAEGGEEGGLGHGGRKDLERDGRAKAARKVEKGGAPVRFDAMRGDRRD